MRRGRGTALEVLQSAGACRSSALTPRSHDPLSLEILAGRFRAGDVISADAVDGKIVFVKRGGGRLVATPDSDTMHP